MVETLSLIERAYSYSGMTPIYIPTWKRPYPRCLKVLDSLPKSWRKFIHFVTPDPSEIYRLGSAGAGYSILECGLPGWKSDMVMTRQFILNHASLTYGTDSPFITMDDDVNSLGVLFNAGTSSRVVKDVPMEYVFSYIRFLADGVVEEFEDNPDISIGIVVPRHRLFSNHISNSETMFTLGSSSYETQFALIYPKNLNGASYDGCSPQTAENLYLYLRMIEQKSFVATLPSAIYSAHYSESESHFWSDEDARKLRHNMEYDLMRSYFPLFRDYIVPKSTYPDGPCKGQKFNNRKFAKDHPWFPRRKVMFDE